MKTTLLTIALLLAVTTAHAALKVGDDAPDVKLKLTGGKTADLSDYRDKWVVLYFYPRADTPGCTKESCSLRDGYDAIRDKGAVVLGASLDNLERQEGFQAKYKLPFALVADDDKVTASAFDVLAVGGLMARRVTFIISPEGRIAHVFDRVKVDRHQEEVLAALEKLQSATSEGPE